MSVINTNITSMIGQQNLSKSQSALTTSMERLSSGLRINSAKDDAAGQAIANRMSAQITGLSQAQRNANDGISVAQTAEGALNQVNDNLQRVRELTVQSQNGTNSQNDLDSIQAEIDQRMGEINRISEQTDFNGVKVLSSTQNINIQVGANDQESIGIELQKIDATSLGLNKFTVSGDKAATRDDLVSNFGATGDATYDAKIDGADATGIKVDVVSGTVTTSGDADLYVSQTTGKITTEGANKDATAASGSTQGQAFVTAFKGQDSGESAVIGGATWTRETAGSDTNGDGVYSATIEGNKVEVTIANSDGTDADFTVTKGSLSMDSSTTDGSDEFVAGTTRFTTHGTNEKAREVDLLDNGAVSTGASLTIGTDAFSVDSGGNVYAGASAITAGGSVGDIAANAAVYIENAGEANAKLIDQADAVEASRDPLEKLDSALGMVDSLRSDLGAIQNRFESAITNLSTNETNLSSARSRIEDADYATEVANMTKAQILQQAGTSVLAQANQIPQNVLSLLG